MPERGGELLLRHAGALAHRANVGRLDGNLADPPGETPRRDVLAHFAEPRNQPFEPILFHRLVLVCHI
jgi:hypothetical protein